MKINKIISLFAFLFLSAGAPPKLEGYSDLKFQQRHDSLSNSFLVVTSKKNFLFTLQILEDS